MSISFLGAGFLSVPIFAQAGNTLLSQKMDSDITVSEKETQTPWAQMQQQVSDLVDENKDQMMEDQVLANLLTIPYEKRQYYFPYIHEETYLPHKIKSHPQIIVWKGKKPTVIAPLMQKFAEEYLDDLPAAFYYFMDPDYWVTPQPTEKIYIPNLILSGNKTQLTDMEVANKVVRPLKDSYILPPEIQKTLHQTDLTAKDTENLKNTLNSISYFIDSYPENKMLPSQLRDLVHDKMPEGIASPFSVWVSNIQQTEIAADFEKFIQQQGWKNADEFAHKADIMLRAVRVNRLSIPQAISLSVLRQKFPIKPNEPLDSTQMYYLMHEAKPADALFVVPYADELKKAFDANNFIRLGLLIYID